MVSNPCGQTVQSGAAYPIIKSDPKVTRKKIADETNLSDSTIARELKRLRDAGIIRRVGSRKTGYWAFTEDSHNSDLKK